MSLHAATRSKTAQPSFTPARSGILQRKCECGGGGAAGLTGKCEECDGNKLQRKAAAHQAGPSSSSTVPAVVHQVLQSSGQPLDASFRAAMEPRFGHDFSRVRVHTDARAAESAEAVHATAYTVGRDVVFGAGQYAPQSEAGRRLLAHELAHVVQQDSGALPQSSGLQVNPAGDRFEQEADSAADALASSTTNLSPTINTNNPARLSRQPPGLQRKASFVTSDPSEEINPAQQIGDNVVPTDKLFLGNTDFKLGNTNLSTTPFNKAVFSLRRPGTLKVPLKDKKAECKFTQEPENVCGYEMKLLKQGSWVHHPLRKNLIGRFPNKERPCQGNGTVTFIVRGEGGDDKLRKKVKVHEEKHATDYKTIFDTYVVPWDRGIASAVKNGLKKTIDETGKCDEALYAAAGVDTPNDVVKNIIDDINAKAATFHGTAAGSKPSATSVDHDTGCDNVIARFE